MGMGITWLQKKIINPPILCSTEHCKARGSLVHGAGNVQVYCGMKERFVPLGKEPCTAVDFQRKLLEVI